MEGLFFFQKERKKRSIMRNIRYVICTCCVTSWLHFHCKLAVDEEGMQNEKSNTVQATPN